MKIFKETGTWMPPLMRRAILVLVVSSGCQLFSGATLADDELLSSGHGYMLIRIKLNQGERVGTFAMSNVDTKQQTRWRTDSFELAGSNSWMALVALPQGRYFWSEYETSYGTGVENVRNLNQMYKRNTPGSADDTFEIVSGMINYAGDWTMRVVPSQRARLDPIIEYDKSTLERYIEQYPELANKHEIYLSVMGKEAISLSELANITKE